MGQEDEEAPYVHVCTQTIRMHRRYHDTKKLDWEARLLSKDRLHLQCAHAFTTYSHDTSMSSQQH